MNAVYYLRSVGKQLGKGVVASLDRIGPLRFTEEQWEKLGDPPEGSYIKVTLKVVPKPNKKA